MTGHSGHAPVGWIGATALVAGGMVGSGVYLLPATMGALGSISLLGWIGATLAALALAGQFAWLSQVAPQAKGLPGYVQAGLGRFAGVQTTVLYWTSSWFGTVAIVLAVVGYAAFLFPALAPAGPRLAATIGVIWGAVAVSWVGPRAVARFEGLTLGVGLLPVVFAGTAGWLYFHPDVFRASWNPQHLSLADAVGASALSAFWAFSGLECAAATAGVVRDPARNVPRATLAGVGLAAMLYISACTALMGLLPADRLAKSGAPFADATTAIVGGGFAAAIAACAMARAWGAVTVFTLVSAETGRGGADEGVFLRAFRTRTGERASAVNLLSVGVLMSLAAVMTAAPSLAQQFGTLTNIAVLLSFYAFILAGVSLMRLSRSFAPGRRVLAILTAALAIAACLVLTASAKPLELASSLAVILIGGLVYLQIRREEPPA